MLSHFRSRAPVIYPSLDDRDATVAAFRQNFPDTEAKIIDSYGWPITGFVFRINIIFENDYGFNGDGVGSGARTFNKFFPRWSIRYWE